MTQITGPMAEALARHREALNARFAAAQMGGARIDAAAFVEHLGEVVERIERMMALARLAGDVGSFLDSGKVLAWRAGMTQYREGALATARKHETPVAARALGLAEGAPAADVAAAIDRITENPWISP